jgi:predicted RNA-binding protein (virulence factor B family)
VSEIGREHELKVAKLVDFGAYLHWDDGELVLLPQKYLPEDLQIDDTITVFIHKDSEDRLIATTEKPYAQVGEFAYLRVKQINNIGAFLDWGLTKDLLVPFSEQKRKMAIGEYHMVYVYVDDVTDRITATAKLEMVVRGNKTEYTEGQEVEVLVGKFIINGYQVVINNTDLGLVYKNEIFQDIKSGKKYKAYIKKLREDGKIDVSFQKSGYENTVSSFSEQIFIKLQKNDGIIALGDKSDPEEIYQELKMSKKNFKKAIGLLYKENKIIIEKYKICLTKK